MEELQLIANQWLGWQVRAFLVSLVLLMAASPLYWRSPLWRHWTLVSGAIVLIALPLILFALPVIEWPIIPSQILVDPFSSPVRMTFEQLDGSSWALFLLACSFLVGTILTCRYFFHSRKLAEKVSQANLPSTELQTLFSNYVIEIGLDPKNLALVISGSNDAPCTMGWLSPKVVLPEGAANWDSEDLRVVLIHELQHIKRRDWLWQQCLIFLVILYPLNPLVWRIKRLARGLAEESVDKLSLAQGIEPTTYADTLLRQLRVCRQVNSSAAVYMQQRVDITARLGSLVAEPYSWPQIARGQKLQVSLVMICLASPFVVLSPVQAPYDFSLEVVDTSAPFARGSEEELVEPTHFSTEHRSKVILIENPEFPPHTAILGLSSVQPEAYEAGPIAGPALERLAREQVSQEPRPLYLAQPDYPQGAHRRGLEATIEVVFDLNKDGEVINPVVVSPRTWRSRQFEPAVLEAIKASRYDVNESAGKRYFKKGLSQSYIFELIDEDRPYSSENVAQNPP